MMRQIACQPLTPAEFAPFGDVLQAGMGAARVINQGMAERFHDLARLDFGPGGRAGLSIFAAKPRSLPLQLDMVERHPDGSQAFIAMDDAPFLIVVAPDQGGIPGTPRAFISNGAQGVNFLRGTWHGVLTPLHPPGHFAVIDRIGDSPNLQEHWFTEPWLITA